MPTKMPVLSNPKRDRFYVYELVDPRDDAVFYVGKGTGRRDRSHLTDARTSSPTNAARAMRIREILAAGHDVVIRRVHSDLTERQALNLERKRIAEIRLANLTNVTRGHSTLADKARATLQTMPTIEKFMAAQPTKYLIGSFFATIVELRFLAGISSRQVSDFPQIEALLAQ